MIKGVEGTRAYNLNGIEVDSLLDAYVLFVDTKEAAEKLDKIESDGGFYDEMSNEDRIFNMCEPNLYVRSAPESYYWLDYDSFPVILEETLNFYNAIKNIKKGVN